MIEVLKAIHAALARMQREWATQKLLGELDERTLKDIGLQSWNGGVRSRLWAQRIGMY